jgi:hypothetical protein
VSHDYHEAHPKFSPNQVLHDGCAECDYRSKSDDAGLSTLSPDRFRLAWQRAAQLWTGRLTDVSDAEFRLLRILAEVQRQLDQAEIASMFGV